MDVVSPSGKWRNASSSQSGQTFLGITPCPGVEPGTRCRGWRSRPVGSPFPRHGRLSRRGFEPRSCAPKAQIVVRWTIGSHGLPSVRQLISYLYNWFRLRNRDQAVPIARFITGAYFGNPGNTTPDHGGCRPCWARHRRNDPDDRTDGVCLPRWVSPRGHATRPRRRRDLNPDHGRDRTV